MNNLLVLLSFICLLGFNDIGVSKTDDKKLNGNIDNFDWLLGNWKRTNVKEGIQTFEHWKHINDTELNGWGYTLKDSDTIGQESMRLIKSDDEWNFEVVQKDSKAPTIFKLTNIEMIGFTCENPDNEFPKKIRYTKVQTGINAVISGDGKVILFQFAKIP